MFDKYHQKCSVSKLCLHRSLFDFNHIASLQINKSVQSHKQNNIFSSFVMVFLVLNWRF